MKPKPRIRTDAPHIVELLQQAKEIRNPDVAESINDGIRMGSSPDGKFIDPQAVRVLERAMPKALASTGWGSAPWIALESGMAETENGGPRVISTGFPQIDKFIGGGIGPRQVVTLVGGTGSGKTSLALQIAVHRARQGAPVLFHSIELAVDSCFARIASQHTGVGSYAILTGGLRAVNEVRAARAEVEKLPLSILEESHAGSVEPIGLRDLIEHANRMTAAWGEPPMIVVDYAQLLAAPDEEGRVRMANDRNMTEFRRWALANKAPVLLICSTARANYKSTEGRGRPPMSEMIGAAKESGGYEFGSSSVIVLRSVPHDGNPGAPRRVEACIAKAREGYTGWAYLDFHGPTGRFVEVDPVRAAAESKPGRKRKYSGEEELRRAVLVAVDCGTYTNADGVTRAVGGTRAVTYKAVKQLIEEGDITRGILEPGEKGPAPFIVAPGALEAHGLSD